MSKSRAPESAVSRAPADGVVTLVISQHEVVRQQLVNYLKRSPSLIVTGDAFSPEAISRTCPSVVVLDLSQLGHGGLVRAIDAARQVGAQLIALASMHDLADERAVTEAGGLYRLKSAGADGLAEIILDVGRCPVSCATEGLSMSRHRREPD